MSHCLSPIHYIFRENRYLLFLTENYAATEILRHYLIDVLCSSHPDSLASINIAPGSDGSGERLLEKMEPFILFGSSFPRDKEYTQVGACQDLHDILFRDDVMVGSPTVFLSVEINCVVILSFRFVKTSTRSRSAWRQGGL